MFTALCAWAFVMPSSHSCIMSGFTVPSLQLPNFGPTYLRQVDRYTLSVFVASRFSHDGQYSVSNTYLTVCCVR